MNNDSCEASATAVVSGLRDAYPDADCELYASNPWQLLVAVILSAQTSDVRVNQVMAVLNEHFLGPQAYARLHPDELQPWIQRVPLFRQKARSIVEAARMVCSHHGGQVPDERQALQRLPGVGPKTAAVVLGNAFDQASIAADLHVQRIVHRLGWAATKNASQAETAIAERVHPEDWVRLCHRLIRLGRQCCRPRRPWCSRCPIANHCPRVNVDDAR